MKTKYRTNKVYAEEGFSIIEIIVLIILIGILTSVAYAHYVNVLNSAKVASCRNCQFSIATTQKVYYLQTMQGETPHFASSLDELKSFFANDEIPECPGGGTYQLHQWGGVTCSIAGHN